MSNSLIGKLAQWGINIEAGTVGAGGNATIGLPLLNGAAIDPGQEWIEDRKQRGTTTLTTLEVIDNTIAPAWAPQTTLFHPEIGMLLASLTQNATETAVGAGPPYFQTVTFDTVNGKRIDYGDTITTGNPTTIAASQKLGQSTNRDVQGLGGVVSRVDISIPASGRCTVTLAVAFMDYNDGFNGSSGVYTLPASSIEKMGRDFIFKLGDGTPSALYSPDVTLSFIADIVPKRYGGIGATTKLGAFPYAWVYNGWSVEGSFSKPVVAATDMLMKDFFVGGGDTGADQLLYVYTTGLTDYNENLATASADGDMRFTMNIKFDSISLGFDDETVESVTFKGVNDGTNNAAKFEQVTTAQQAWAS